MSKKKKIIMLSIMILGIINLTLGITFSLFNFTKMSINSSLVLGDIYMHYKESNELVLDNIMPTDTYDEDNYFEFTIDGKNTYQDKDIWYEIVLSHGDNHATRTERLQDKFLRFTLIETKDGKDVKVLEDMTYDDLTNQRIWINTIPRNTNEEISITYKLYCYVNGVLIGNTENADYSEDVWSNQIYASFRVNVIGDFVPKTLPGYIIYDANGGDNTPRITRVDTGYITEEQPVLENQTFLGWSTTKNGEVVYKSGEEYTGDAIILYAQYKLNDTSVLLMAGNTTSNDEGKVLTLERFAGDITDNQWVILQEYDGTSNRGSSRFTIKVDKDFISDDDNYYDISIDYYDAGIGVVLLQTSTDQDNTINYSATGYGGYPEESYWSWQDGYYYSNITFNLTNTKEWKTYTFRVTDEFFEDNVDNYIHFYFGRSVNYNDTLKIKSVKVTKKIFKIDSIDKNNTNNTALIGNIYTNNDFGMGFKVYNTSDSSQKMNLSYQILDSNNNIVYTKDYGSIIISKKETKKFYLDKSLDYGTYKLIVNVKQDDVLEVEEIKFSKMIANLSNQSNEFLGANSFFGYSGWSSSNQIKNTINVGEKLGIKNVRSSINSQFINEDKAQGWYSNLLGRYEDIYDSVFDTYNQDVLFTVHYISSTFASALNEIIDMYKLIAQKYGSELEYYEILNESNITGILTAEEYAEVLVKTSIAIKQIDNDAKIVAIDSNRIPIYENSDYSNYSDNSWIARVLNTTVGIDENSDGTIDQNINPMEVIDVISVHPYTDSAATSPGSAGTSKSIFKQLTDLRTFIEAYKSKYNVTRDIPIWLTEVGFQTSYYGITEEQQAAYLSQTLIWSLANKSTTTANIQKVFIYCLQNTGLSNSHSEANFGIVDVFKTGNLKGYTRDVEMAAKQSYITTNMFSYLLNGATLLENNSTDNYYCYKFKDSTGKKTIITAWNNQETANNQNISITVPTGNIIVYDIYGNILNKLTNSSGSMNIDIDYKPKYIVISN